MRSRGDVRKARGMFLVQLLVYLAILAVISFLAFDLFFSLSSGARRVRIAGEDIVRTMNVGERWRGDVRAAGTVVAEGGSIRMGNVSYELSDGAVKRIEAGRVVTVLPNVLDSRFVRDARTAVIAWRWELELVNPDSRSKMKSLFTFIAVNAREVGE